MDWLQTDVSSNQITSIDDFITKYAAGTHTGYFGHDCNVAFAFDGSITSYLKKKLLVVALHQSVLHQPIVVLNHLLMKLKQSVVLK